MAKKRFKMKKKAKTIKKDTAKTLEAAGDFQVAAGRYANHIQITPNEEEFVLDFFARAGQPTVAHVGRFFIAPNHARRLMDLLRSQIILHKKMFPNSPLKQSAPKRKGRA